METVAIIIGVIMTIIIPAVVVIAGVIGIYIK